jgi:hypothetical protein
MVLQTYSADKFREIAELLSIRSIKGVSRVSDCPKNSRGT